MLRAREHETQVWRILLFAHKGSELLLLRRPAGFRLPQLHIPRFERVAPNLNTEAKRLWKLDTIALYPMELADSSVVPPECNFHVMELCQPEELAWVAPDVLMVSSLKEDLFADRQDYLAVRKGMGFDSTAETEDSRGPFSAFGSFQQISAWVQSQLDPAGLRWNGSFRQLQASPSFALIRFELDHGAVWFKAVGEPNTREFHITKELTERFPAFMPESLGVSAEWNAWLTREAEGQDLFTCTEVNGWQQTAEALAELQIASIPHTTQVLAAGSRDARPRHLIAIANSFFAVVERLMEQQTKSAPRPLRSDEIDALKEDVLSHLRQMELIGFPDTLNHLDLNPGNVIVSRDKCTFLDWAEAAVGNPFLSLEYLRQHFRRTFPGREDAEARLCDSYLRCWKSVLPADAVKQVLPLVPLTALFAYAASCLPWNDPSLKNNLQLNAFLRSLARRMHRESEQLTDSEVV